MSTTLQADLDALCTKRDTIAGALDQAQEMHRSIGEQLSTLRTALRAIDREIGAPADGADEIAQTLRPQVVDGGRADTG